MPKDDWSLSGFSAALEQQRLSREEQRKQFSDGLEKVGAVVFVPFEDGPEGHGLGWFRADKGFVAFRRYSNGYDMLRAGVIEDDLLLKLVEHIPKKD